MKPEPVPLGISWTFRLKMSRWVTREVMYTTLGAAFRNSSMVAFSSAARSPRACTTRDVAFGSLSELACRPNPPTSHDRPSTKHRSTSSGPRNDHGDDRGAERRGEYGSSANDMTHPHIGRRINVE